MTLVNGRPAAIIDRALAEGWVLVNPPEGEAYLERGDHRILLSTLRLPLVGEDPRLELRLVVPGRPESPNETRREHWSHRAGYSRKLRRDARLAAIDAKNRSGAADRFPIDSAEVELVFVLEAARGDLDNLVAGSKPILDGLVDARVLASDAVRNVLSLSARWRRGRTAAVEITIRETGR